MRVTNWGVWCVREGAAFFFTILKDVPWSLTEKDARELADKVNRAGRYRAVAKPLSEGE